MPQRYAFGAAAMANQNCESAILLLDDSQVLRMGIGAAAAARFIMQKLIAGFQRGRVRRVGHEPLAVPRIGVGFAVDIWFSATAHFQPSARSSAVTTRPFGNSTVKPSRQSWAERSGA